jgi:CRP/FNR family transcriptional regulator, cyclic AMP receptor protein
MATDQQKGVELRRALDKAIDKDRPKDVIAALAGLEQLERSEPRWPQRLGDALVRSGRKQEAEAAYVRAFDMLVRLGFLPRAVAMGKVIVSINPARSDILDRISQDSARNLRQKPIFVAPAAPKLQPAAPAANLAPAPPDAFDEAIEIEVPDGRLSLLPNIQPPSRVSGAKVLEPAVDAAQDEVRFDDLTDEEIIELDASDMEAISIAAESVVSPAATVVDESAEWMSKMSATALFADVSPAALVELIRAAQRLEFRDGETVFRKGAYADALYAIVDGVARVGLPELPVGAIDLAAGQIFGEACLVKSGSRTADVIAMGSLVLLKIATADLHRIMAVHPELSDVLFGLLTGRLIANLLQTSALFADFDAEQRKELARMFEVRRAAAGTVLQETGKRSDGLYLALLGDLEMQEGGLIASVAPGTVFGHTSLLAHTPADRTVTAGSEAVVLRMPASRFGRFAAEFPPALDHLTELASKPMSMWPEG